jgi:hypothetical protein
MGRKKAPVAEVIAALTNMTQRSDQIRQQQTGNEKEKEVTLLPLTADDQPRKKRKVFHFQKR